MGGGASRRRRDAGTNTVCGKGDESRGSNVTAQLQALPRCTAEAGVGTDERGGTCHVATCAVVDSCEQGTDTRPLAVADAAVQAADDHFRSFEEVADFCKWYYVDFCRRQNSTTPLAWPPVAPLRVMCPAFWGELAGR